jgi:hypothetical protein
MAKEQGNRKKRSMLSAEDAQLNEAVLSSEADQSNENTAPPIDIRILLLRSSSIFRFLHFCFLGILGLDVTLRLSVFAFVAALSVLVVYGIERHRRALKIDSPAYQMAEQHQKLLKRVGNEEVDLKSLSVNSDNTKHLRLMRFNLLLDGFALFNTGLLLFHLVLPSLFPTVTSLSLLLSASGALILTALILPYFKKHELELVKSFVLRKNVKDNHKEKAEVQLIEINKSLEDQHFVLDFADKSGDSFEIAKSFLKTSQYSGRIELDGFKSWWLKNVFGLLISVAAVVLFIGIWFVPGQYLHLIPFTTPFVHQCLFEFALCSFLAILYHFHHNPYKPVAAGRFFGMLYFLLGIGASIGMSLLPEKLGLATLLPPLNAIVTDVWFKAAFIVVAVLLSCYFAWLNYSAEKEDDGIAITHLGLKKLYHDLSLEALIHAKHIRLVDTQGNEVQNAVETLQKLDLDLSRHLCNTGSTAEGKASGETSLLSANHFVPGSTFRAISKTPKRTVNSKAQSQQDEADLARQNC